VVLEIDMNDINPYEPPRGIAPVPKRGLRYPAIYYLVRLVVLIPMLIVGVVLTFIFALVVSSLFLLPIAYFGGLEQIKEVVNSLWYSLPFLGIYLVAMLRGAQIVTKILHRTMNWLDKIWPRYPEEPSEVE
jgi:uncharacterized membrane protein